VETNGIKHPASNRTPLLAQQYLYSIWLTDLARHQETNVEEDPILDALSLSFIEGLVTVPHPQLFPKVRDFPPSTQLSLPQSQAQFPSLSFPLRSIVILVQECLNYVAELQAFVNHCRFILGSRQTRIINHSITELHEITPAPAIFSGHLWRYRILINLEGILEDYRIIARTTDLPIVAALQHAFTVYYDWNAQGYTVSIDE